MEKDKSFLLQKQIKNNAQDIQNEYLDLKIWEEKMKIADKELQSSSVDSGQTLPPVRKKKLTTRTKSKTKENCSKAKKIKSSDYSSWDRYDADKACEEIDKENESEDSGEEILSKEELDEKYTEATKHKVMGNKYVTQQKWDKAMACYNEAIKIFPFDAIFYANRALCHLKMDNIYSAEADCTSAIQRDEAYVKAYHRRATARIVLKQYKEAIEDLQKLLSLEPSNKEAKKMLSNAERYLDNSKPSAIIDELKKSEKQSEIEKETLTKTQTVVLKNEKIDINLSKKEPEVTTKLPQWLPISIVGENVEIVEPVLKLPHQQSKVPMKSIPITIADLSLIKDNVRSCSSNDDGNVDDKVKKNILPSDQSEKTDIDRKKEEEEEDKVLNELSAPTTAIHFLLIWRKYKSSDFRYKYLKKIPPENIPSIFKDSMELDVFGEILSILNTHFIPHQDEIFSYLQYLSQIKRFSMLTMFLSKDQKQDLNILFDYCKNIENKSENVINEIRNRYEI